MSLTSALRKIDRARWISLGLFPLLLFLYALSGAERGVDLTDTTYSLGNYLFLRELRGDWSYATGLANLSGQLLLALSGGSMLRMTRLCRILLAVVALTSYFGLRREVSSVAAFLGNWLAISVSWCPAVILYNYLSYLLLTAAAVLLYHGLKKDRRLYFLGAGYLLGLSLFVRISNLIYCALILYVWLGNGLRLGVGAKRAGRQTAACVFSYLAGALSGLLLVSLGLGGIKGIREMLLWVSGLASAQGDAGGYSLGAMAATVARAYLWAGQRFLPMAAVLLLGVALWRWLSARRYRWLRRGIYALALALLYVYYYRRGVYTSLYHSNGSIYGIYAILLVVLLLLFLFMLLFSRGAYRIEDQALALLGILLLLIAPLGTNNHLYAVINQLYLILPIGLGLAIHLFSYLYHKKSWMPLLLGAASFLLLLLMQGTLFHNRYSFVDGENGAVLDAAVEGVPALEGMKTSAAHAAAVEGVCGALEGESTLLAYGNIPGLYYAAGLRPVLTTLWVDLESYAAKSLREELQTLEGERPIVVLSEAARERIAGLAEPPAEDGVSESIREKDELLAELLTGGAYEIKYENEEFTIYAVADGQ